MLLSKARSFWSGILVGPVPLMAGDLDRHVRVRHPVHVIHQLEGRDRDDDQDQHRHDRPQDLDDGVVRGARRHRVAPVVEAHDHIEQQPHDKDRDQKDDDQELVVERVQPVLDRGRRAAACRVARAAAAPPRRPPRAPRWRRPRAPPRTAPAPPAFLSAIPSTAPCFLPPLIRPNPAAQRSRHHRRPLFRGRRSKRRHRPCSPLRHRRRSRDLRVRLNATKRRRAYTIASRAPQPAQPIASSRRSARSSRPARRCRAAIATSARGRRRPY